MTPAAGPEAESNGFVRLAAAAPLHTEPDVIAELLAGEECPWRGGAVVRPVVAGMRRYALDLRLRLGGDPAGLATFRKAAFLDVGPPRRTAEGWVAEVSWRASRGAPLFPVFSGWLFVGRSELRIEGLYAPPMGTVGRVADRVLLHTAANGTARWILHELDRAALGAAG